ncbi:MAG: dephospho-CoA kinase [Candidatus Omnitrophica bacterium]|nr:dephospho-CoA kinase [Candidatus Omnitrophota bacterium]
MKKRKQNKKLIVGLTGSFGTGKSTVAGMLRTSATRVIDADRISHDLIKPHGKVYKNIIRLLGKGIAGKNGVINRRDLGKKVFSSRNYLVKFNKIMHPAIISKIQLRIKKAKEEVVILDAPLLFETGLVRIADKVVVVKASLDNQIRRVQKKSGLSKAEIILRIKSQIPLKEKLRLADFVIDNNGTVANTRKQAVLIRRSWWRS